VTCSHPDIAIDRNSSRTVRRNGEEATLYTASCLLCGWDTRVRTQVPSDGKTADYPAAKAETLPTVAEVFERIYCRTDTSEEEDLAWLAERDHAMRLEAVRAALEAAAIVDPLSVTCPFPLCNSVPFAPCWDTDRGEPASGVHHWRWRVSVRRAIDPAAIVAGLEGK